MLKALCNNFQNAEKATILAMKLTAIILLTAGLTASANGHSQITLSEKNAPLPKVLKEIQRQTGYEFFYSFETLQKAGNVDVELKGVSIESALTTVLKGKHLGYEIIRKTVVIKELPAGIPREDPSINVTAPPPIDVKGRVINEKGEPVLATVTVKGTNTSVSTDTNGFFVINNVAEDAVLVISSVSIEKPVELKVSGKSDLATVVVKMKIKEGEAVTVYSTGYQEVRPNQATGSFAHVNKELLNRRVSTNILERIENLTTGVSFATPNEPTSNNPYAILIRGRNSIFSNVAPLIVVDNFPYDGNINNINPNDIEGITILKDAAAAAVWGARAGNGVIVITTKRGTSSKPRLNINSNLSYTGKPDLYKKPRISTDDYIELEKWLFDQGYYNAEINNAVLRPPLTPVVELLLQKRNGTITAAEADAKINSFKGTNVIDDMEKYFYQSSLAQRHSIDVSGNTQYINYYLSAGFDRTVPNLTGGIHSDRISLKSQNTFKVAKNFEIETGVNYVQLNGVNVNNGGIDNINSGFGKQLYPYADLVDDNGQGLVLVRDMRGVQKDTMGGGKILDWRYRPYSEINETEGSSKGRDFLLNTGIRYKFNDNLRIELRYQFQNGLASITGLQKQGAYNTKDLINKFYQPNAVNKFPVPIGGILDVSNSEFISHQGRIQLNYNKSWKQKHDVGFLAGWEIKDLTTKGNNYRLYGYSKEGSRVNTGMDFVTQFPQFNYGPFASFILQRIPNFQSISQTSDRFVSYFANLSYTYDKRYTFTASGREDAANLFGVRTNQKGVPLWSVGAAWQINNEKFYNIGWLEELRLRASYGYNGNFSRQVSAVSTINYPVTPNYMGLTYAEILNPPNADLRWERNKIMNLGIDFSTKGGRIAGSLEYYNKKNIDLMAQAPIDPTSGFVPVNGGASYVFKNVASMKGHGLEIMLTTRNIDNQLKWTSTLLYSTAFSTVYEYFLPPPTTASAYVGVNGTPLIGKPLFKIYAYQWAGLDPTNGDPMGYLGKDISKDYNSILNNTKIDSLAYYANSQPTHFGALRNDFSWKNISLSVNISYKFGYYFQRPTLTHYSSLYNTWMGHSDYAKRWQNPGDEVVTDVPSRVYPNYPQFSNRENFYSRSAILVEKGDHIRLEDINISYLIDKTTFSKLPFREIRLYAYLTNLKMMIWKANKAGIDPAFRDGNINPLSISFGLNIGL